jgi:signal transduction histidine kinase
MPYRYVVLGAGRQGTAAGYDFARHGEAAQVVMADADPAQAQRSAARINALVGREVAVPAGLPIVLGDMPRVVQILEAMLDNAHKYTPEGGWISLQAEAVAGGVEVRVCDSGPGIAAEDAPRVFGAFFRSEIPEVRAHPGWGLSLHVAKQLAEHMGGALGFANRPEGGVCFWLRLQAAESRESPTA